jgi:prepilin-type N-terminal cleavage/methylation domain-containing protein
MKTRLSCARAGRWGQRGFTFAEVMMSIAITLVMFVAFYASMSSGVRTIQVARENLRATEILVGEMEDLRLLRWDQLTNTIFLPTSFTVSYNQNGTNAFGVSYTGTVAVASVPWGTPTSYSANMKQVSITLNWNSWGVQRQRSMTNYCAEFGVQPYVWNMN